MGPRPLGRRQAPIPVSLQQRLGAVGGGLPGFPAAWGRAPWGRGIASLLKCRERPHLSERLVLQVGKSGDQRSGSPRMVREEVWGSRRSGDHSRLCHSPWGALTRQVYLKTGPSAGAAASGVWTRRRAGWRMADQPTGLRKALYRGRGAPRVVSVSESLGQPGALLVRVGRRLPALPCVPRRSRQRSLPGSLSPGARCPN